MVLPVSPHLAGEMFMKSVVGGVVTVDGNFHVGWQSHLQD